MTKNEFIAKIILLGFKRTESKYLRHPNVMYSVIISTNYFIYKLKQYKYNSESMAELYTIILSRLHK